MNASRCELRRVRMCLAAGECALVCLVVAVCAGGAGSAGSAIQVRDERMSAEDAVLARRLAARLRPGPRALALLARPSTPAPSAARKAPPARAPSAARRQKEYQNVPTVTETDALMLRLMEQMIYLVQYRIKEFTRTSGASDQKDFRLRLMYADEQLIKWIMEMVYIIRFEWMYRKEAEVHEHLMYYTHLVRLNVDITYTIELVIELHYEYLDPARPGHPAGSPGLTAGVRG